MVGHVTEITGVTERDRLNSADRIVVPFPFPDHSTSRSNRRGCCCFGNRKDEPTDETRKFVVFVPQLSRLENKERFRFSEI